MKYLFLIITLVFSISHGVASSENALITPAKELVRRMTPEVASQIHFSINQDLKQTIVIEQEKSGGIIISAGNTAGLTGGYGYYLKNIALVDFSWNGDRLDIPHPIPVPKEKITVKKPWKEVFAFNYCSLSYSSAFWDWKRWERELDFLSLNGVTHALVTAGLEKTWQEFLRSCKYPEKDILEFIPSPAFAAWWNMGNLEGHGGPMTQHLIDQEADLGRRIATRMHELGMTPVLQAYIGIIPAQFEEKSGSAGMRFIEQGEWCGFKRPSVLDPTCEAFPSMAAKWYECLHRVYGDISAAYGGDLFHEGGKSKDINVTKAAQAVQQAMQKASPGSIWVLQAWQRNPTPELLAGTMPEHTLVLQLTKNLVESGGNLRTFGDTRWVWCELSNFGGISSLYGGIPLLAHLGNVLRPYEQCTGIGILPEGIEGNPMYYAMFFDRIWSRDDFDTTAWIKNYALRRYGTVPDSIVEALNILANAHYKPIRDQEGGIESILCARPGWDVKKSSSWAPTNRHYKLEDSVNAARLFVKAAEDKPELLQLETFKYDLIDIVRQASGDACLEQLQLVKQAFQEGNIASYDRETAIFMTLMDGIDTLLACDRHFMAGVYFQRAINKGSNEKEKALMLKSAKMLVTTWVDKTPHYLNDYSNRQWSGLIKDFYMPRWQIFFSKQRKVLEGKDESGNAIAEINSEINQHHMEFIGSPKLYPADPAGNELEIARKLINELDGKMPKYNEINASLDRALKWNLETGDEFSFNVTDQITGNGTYTATFQWVAGSSALRILSLDVYEGDKLIARDSHIGWAGLENDDNIYRFEIKEHKAKQTPYILKAKVKGVSSKESEGILIIHKK